MSQRNKQLAATVGLTVAVAIWGLNFVVVKDAVSRWPVFPFLALRFWIATVAFIPLMLIERASGNSGCHPSHAIRPGMLAGLALFAAYATQTVGIQLTTASNAAFVTSLFVVFVPLLGFLTRKSIPNRNEWFAAVLAIGGVVILNRYPLPGLQLGTLLLLVCALAYAAQILLVGALGRNIPPVRFTMIQLATVATLSSLVILPNAIRGTLPSLDIRVMWAALFTGVFASALAYLIQVRAQRHISSTRAAVLMAMEPVFAILGAVALATEVLTLAKVIGGALILGAFALCQAKPSTGN